MVGELEVNQEVDDDEWNIGDGFGHVIDEKTGMKLDSKLVNNVAKKKVERLEPKRP